MCIIFTAGSRSAELITTLNFKIIGIVKFIVRFTVSIIVSVIFIIIRSKHIVSIIIFPVVEPRVPILMEVPTRRSCTGSNMSSISRTSDELNSSNEQSYCNRTAAHPKTTLNRFLSILPHPFSLRPSSLRVSCYLCHSGFLLI